MANRVVIVGAGYAGIEAALTLNKKTKKNEIEITLIDQNTYHTLLTELHEVAGNRVSEEAIRIPYQRIFKYTKVNVICDRITNFDFENQSVGSSENTYDYDYLMLALGSQPNFYGIPGLREHAFTLWSFEDAVRIREHIKSCFVLAKQEADRKKRAKLLTFVVAGAGFTGVEMIGELAHWSKDLAHVYGIDRKEIRLVLVDMMSQILNTLSEKNAASVHRYLEKKLGVEMMLNTSVKEAKEDGFATQDQFVRTKTLIWAAGIRASEEVDQMPVEIMERSKRVKVDEFCKTKYQNVYSVGDVTALLGEEGKPYPAMVENAIQTAHGAAENILRDIHGKPPMPVKVTMHGIMVSVGNYYAVSEIMGRSLASWLSILMKFLVNIHYLWEIAGFSGVARYLYHEVLERKQRKWLLEKHWSTRIQAWWTVPLRIFLGGTWVYEGISKIYEGWLTTPKLAAFLGLSTDINSSATYAAPYVKRVDEIFRLNAGIFNFLLGSENRLVQENIISSTPLAKLELFHIGTFNPIPWFLQHVVLYNETVSMFFQILVVILEIGIGLALMGGAFTFLASVVSLGLMMMFITSTGLYEKTWWMIFASIALMGGAGRAFGIDYYLIPYLNNIWEYFWKNRRFKLFFKGNLDRSDE